MNAKYFHEGPFMTSSAEIWPVHRIVKKHVTHVGSTRMPCDKDSREFSQIVPRIAYGTLTKV